MAGAKASSLVYTEKNKRQSKYQVCLHVVRQISFTGALFASQSAYFTVGFCEFRALLCALQQEASHIPSPSNIKHSLPFHEAEALSCFTCGLFKFAMQ